MGKVAGKLACQLNAHPAGYRLYLDQALMLAIAVKPLSGFVATTCMCTIDSISFGILRAK